MEGANALHAGQAHRHVVALEDGSILNRYWDDSDAPRDESDRRMSCWLRRPPGRRSRCFATSAQVLRAAGISARGGSPICERLPRSTRPKSSPSISIALLFGLENAIREGCERAGDADCAGEFAKHAAERRAAIDRYLWDPSRGVYLDYRWTLSERHRAGLPPPRFIRCSRRSQRRAGGVSGENRRGGTARSPAVS